jgi:hypothetical protein
MLNWLDTVLFGLRTVLVAGTAIGDRPAMNFTGDGVTVTENAEENRIDIDIPAAAPPAPASIWDPVAAVCVGDVDLSATVTAADGYTTVVGDRIGLVDQAELEENGIYIVGSDFKLDRAADADAAADFFTGKSFTVKGGTTRRGREYVLSSATPITLGSGDLLYLERTPTLNARYIAKGNGSTNDTASIQSALVATSELLYTSGTYRLGTTATIGSVGQTHVFARGAKIRVPSGVTITMRGTITAAPNQQIFQVDSGGTLLLPDMGDIVHAGWFGCVPGNAAFDNAIPLAVATKACPGREVLFGDGSYTFLTGYVYHQTPPDGLPGTEEAPKFRGCGIDRTILDCRAANVAAFDFDVNATAQYYFLRGLSFRRLRITGGETSPANASAIKYKKCYLTTIEDVRIENFTKRGIWVECTEGDYDASNQSWWKNVWIYGCALWGFHVDCASGRNEISYTTLENVLVESCGTADSSAPSDDPASGGGCWKGQILGGHDVAFVTCEEVGLFIYGQSGLANTVRFGKLTFENCKKRAFRTTGVNNLYFGDLQVFQNDQFRAAYGIYLDGTGFDVRNATFARAFFRVTDGLRTWTSYDHTTGTFTFAGHGLNIGDRVEVQTSGGTLPDAFTATTVYYVIAAGLTSSTFRLSATPGGAALTGTTDGTGTNKFAWSYVGFEADGGNVGDPVVLSTSWYAANATTGGLGTRFGAGFLGSHPFILDGGDIVANDITAAAITADTITADSGSFGTHVEVGDGATVGAFRAPKNGVALAAPNNASSADIRLVRTDTSNNITAGDTTANHFQAQMASSGQFQFLHGATAGWITYIVSSNTYYDPQGRNLFIANSGAPITLNSASIALAPTGATTISANGSTRATFGTTGFSLFGRPEMAQWSAYTQTYSTADKTLSAYTPDNESGAYTGIDNAQVGTVYATLTDLNALRVAYENLRVFSEDLAQFVNSLINDLRNRGDLAT